MNTPNLGLPLLDIFQAQKEVTVNQAFAIIDSAYASLQASGGGTGGTGTPGSQLFVQQGAPDLSQGISGDVYLDMTTGNVYKKTFSGWGLPLGTLKGEPGKVGPIGNTGVAGIDGRDGVDGAPGKDGRDGVDGKDGINGTSGGAQRFTVFEDLGQFLVPADTTQVHILAWGAGSDGQSFGADETNPALTIGGGAGAYVEALMRVTPGETLFITAGAPRGSVNLHTVVCKGANPSINDKSDGSTPPAGTTFKGSQNVVLDSSTTAAVIAGSAVGRDGGTGSIFNANGQNPEVQLISSIAGEPGRMGTTVFGTIVGGSGGNAPAGGTGGSGIVLLPSPAGGNLSLRPDGATPGGGGAAMRMGISAGRGAPGRVIIRY